MKRAVKWVAGLVTSLAILVAAAIAVLASLDFNRYRDLVAARAEAALGRKLAISGDLAIKLSLAPTLAVEGVSLANVPSGSRPNMVEVRRVEVQLEIAPLLKGEVRLKRVVVDGLDVVLESDASGRGNWEFGAAGEAARSGGAGAVPFVADILINDLALAYVDGRGGRRVELRLDALRVRSEAPDAPLAVEVGGRYETVGFAATGTLAPIPVLMANRSYPLSLAAQAVGATIRADGAIAEPLRARGLDLAIAVEGDRLKATLEGLSPFAPALKDLAALDLGPYRLSFRLGGSAEKLGITDLKLAMGGPETARIEATGAVANVLAAKGIEIEFSVKAKDPAALAKAAGATVPPIDGLAVAGRVSDVDGGYALDGFRAEIGKSRLEGRGKVLLARGRPEIEVAVDWQAIDLADILPRSAEPRPAKPAAAPSAAARVFPTDPLRLDGLRAADVKASMRGRRLVVDGLVAENVEIDATLERGKLELKRLQANLAGGAIGGRLSLDASRPAAELDASLQITGLDGGALLKAAKLSDWLQGGRVDVGARLVGAGRSPAEIVAGLNGDIEATVGEGRLSSRAVDLFGADLTMEALRALNPFADKDEFTRLVCGALKVAVKDGMASAENGVAVETAKMNVVGSGIVDLRTERIDLAFKPEPREGLGIGFGKLAGLVRVRGTLAEPKPVIDELGAAKGALSAGAAFATGGLSLLAEGLVGRATADATPCLTALGKAPAAKAPTQAAPSPAERGKGGVGGFFRNLGRSLEDALGGKK